MKRILGLTFLILFGFKGFAADRDGRIIISYPQTQGVWVQVDGRQYNGYNNSVVVSNLSPGYHSVRVYRREVRKSGIFGVFGSRDKLIYSTNLDLRPGYHAYVSIDRYGRARIEQRRMNDKRYDDRHGRENRDWGYRGRDSRDRRDREGDDDWRYENDNRGRDGRDRKDREDNDDWRYENDNRGNISQGRFSRMMQDLRNEYNDNRRFSAAKEYAQTYSFSSVQVKEMTQLFNHDKEKLDIAKHAYRNTVDKGNYSILYDVFRSKKSRKELEKFVKNYS